MSVVVSVYVLRNDFPEMADHLEEGAEEVAFDAAQEYVAIAQSQLRPGHGYDTGRMHDGLEAHPDGSVTAEAPYTWAVNNGWGSFPGYHFLDAAELHTRQYLEEAWVEHVVGAIRAGR